jgi:hypothetical protein
MSLIYEFCRFLVHFGLLSILKIVIHLKTKVVWLSKRRVCVLTMEEVEIQISNISHVTPCLRITAYK